MFWFLNIQPKNDGSYGRYLQLLPISISLRTSSTHLTSRSCNPTTWTCCLPSSNTLSFVFLFNKSKTLGGGKNRTVKDELWKTLLFQIPYQNMQSISWKDMIEGKCKELFEIKFLVEREKKSFTWQAQNLICEREIPPSSEKDQVLTLPL